MGLWVYTSSISARMGHCVPEIFDGPLEGPATGPAAAALEGWSAKERGQGAFCSG